MNNYIEEVLKEFEEGFVNSHNKGEERFLRGLFLDDFRDFMRKIAREAWEKGREEGEKETVNEIIAFRSGYVYDDYSSLYQKSGELWTEYAKKENDFLMSKLDKLKDQSLKKGGSNE